MEIIIWNNSIHRYIYICHSNVTLKYRIAEHREQQKLSKLFLLCHFIFIFCSAEKLPCAMCVRLCVAIFMLIRVRVHVSRILVHRISQSLKLSFLLSFFFSSQATIMRWQQRKWLLHIQYEIIVWQRHCDSTNWKWNRALLIDCLTSISFKSIPEMNERLGNIESFGYIYNIYILHTWMAIMASGVLKWEYGLRNVAWRSHPLHIEEE